VLDVELPWLEDIQSARAPQRLPVVLTRDEVLRVLTNLRGTHALWLLYGTGTRVMEAMRLRVKDVDFERGEIHVRDGKGLKDRVTVLPRSIVPQLRAQVELARVLHARDLKAGCGDVWLPAALTRKYRSAARTKVEAAICAVRRAVLPRRSRPRCWPNSESRSFPSPQPRT